ncbi:MAG: methylenetetrahydrofolate reductase C-terminal domain-containing protein [Phycisphaeraceae bacterium]|nr:methylenetetrahydrofolate reductase C-terminal domain-containing protein [Phycisphaeraceae bacterium]
MFEKSVARVEAFLKGMAFDCRACGQCVLRETGLICPMTCPKGLRNGPCGGTLNGECEVYPDKPCVWIRIHKRTGKESLDCPKLLPSPDARLIQTSSYLNYLTGADEHGRKPLPYLDLGSCRTRATQATLSRLELRLRSGAFVRLCELRAPRTSSFAAFDEQAGIIRDHFDAVNATAFLNARPSLPSPVAAARLVTLGVEPICQSTCRDHTKTSFIAELLLNQINGVHNTLCLTGDSYRGTPKIKQVYDMDAALMVYEARYLRETGRVHFTQETMEPPPRPFIGAVINPLTMPIEVPVRRLKQKAAAGADFIQTQLIFDIEGFRRFMELVRSERIDDDLFIIAGVPVVTSKQALAILPKIPGVSVPEEIFRRLDGAANIRAEGLALARESIAAISAIEGVAGVHLMLFGSDHSVLPGLVADLKTSRQTPSKTDTKPASIHLKQLPTTKEETCPSAS